MFRCTENNENLLMHYQNKWLVLGLASRVYNCIGTEILENHKVISFIQNLLTDSRMAFSASCYNWFPFHQFQFIFPRPLCLSWSETNGLSCKIYRSLTDDIMEAWCSQYSVTHSITHVHSHFGEPSSMISVMAGAIHLSQCLSAHRLSCSAGKSLLYLRMASAILILY
jgi:hypothetical protein